MAVPRSGYALIVQQDEDYDSVLSQTGGLRHGPDVLAQNGTGGLSAVSYDESAGSSMPQANVVECSGSTRPGFRKTKPSRATRHRSGSAALDPKAINARFERWADAIVHKFKGKRARLDAPDKEVLYSIFSPHIALLSDGTKPMAFDHQPPYTEAQFEQVISSIRQAISSGVLPRLISQGSSGSYFALNPSGRVVAVFKPKNEEPYGDLNPKLMKWLHRTLFPFFFGRSCLIPNLSYLSEAAACVLDRRLETYLVPHTATAWLSSASFNYSYLDRRANYRKGKPFPPKLGSLQIFLEGYQDANQFFKENPWPDKINTSFDIEGLKNKRSWGCLPRRHISNNVEHENNRQISKYSEQSVGSFVWTPAIQQQFREELEKLVILDYIMRNTDRGLDNWMIKICWEMLDSCNDSGSDATVSTPTLESSSKNHNTVPTPHLHIGAIDNSLAFPIKHPDEWRSYPFGWLFLPVSLIGQPFSDKTRNHFLPLLTSVDWWIETTKSLRRVFSLDSDFQERMFARQLAVLKGQAWNVVETLKRPTQGPLDLTRQTRMYVWDEEIEVPIAVPMDHLSKSATGSTRTRSKSLLTLIDGTPKINAPLDGHTKIPMTSVPARHSYNFEARPKLSRNSHSDAALASHLNSPERLPTADLPEDEEMSRVGDCSPLIPTVDQPNRKMVIVERLEKVKGRQPVFTWC